MSDSTALQWGCCGQSGLNDKFIECKKCRKSYHLSCMALTEKSVLPPSWLCPDCTNQRSKASKNDNTPVRNVTTTRGSKRVALTSPKLTSETTLSHDDVRHIVEDAIRKELKNMVMKINESMNTKLESLTNEIAEMNKSMQFMNSQYEDMVKEHAVSREAIKEMANENLNTQKTITDLTLRICQLEQLSRSNNVEIQCVPEDKNENLIHVVTNISKVVGCDITEKEITNCTRVAKLDRKNSRPRSIVAQLATTRHRDQLLAAVSSYNRQNPHNKLNNLHLGHAGQKIPIFITEHLSPSNKSLHAAARLKAKERDYKFVWVRNGRIFVRKNETSDKVLIKNMDTLQIIV